VMALIGRGAPLTHGYDLTRGPRVDSGSAVDLALLHKRQTMAMQILNSVNEGVASEIAMASGRSVVWAARDGQLTLLADLLSRRADAASCNHEGCSALLLAASRDQKECVEALLSFGAWHGEDEFGRTKVQHWVVHFKLMHVFSYHDDILRDLEERSGAQKREKKLVPFRNPYFPEDKYTVPSAAEVMRVSQVGDEPLIFNPQGGGIF